MGAQENELLRAYLQCIWNFEAADRWKRGFIIVSLWVVVESKADNYVLVWHASNNWGVVDSQYNKYSAIYVS